LAALMAWSALSVVCVAAVVIAAAAGLWAIVGVIAGTTIGIGV